MAYHATLTVLFENLWCTDVFESSSVSGLPQWTFFLTGSNGELERRMTKRAVLALWTCSWSDQKVRIIREESYFSLAWRPVPELLWRWVVSGVCAICFGMYSGRSISSAQVIEYFFYQPWCNYIMVVIFNMTF